MREDRVLRGILETLRHSEVPAKDILHYARIGVLLTEDQEDQIAARIAEASEEDHDSVAAEGWGESGHVSSTEGAYLLAQFRHQLRSSVCDLYAFSDEVDRDEAGRETPALAILDYSSDDAPRAWAERPDRPTSGHDLKTSKSETFPRSRATSTDKGLEGELLVVPKP